MAEQPRDDEREERIHNEIVVDAYGPEEQALGWYVYLDETLQFPFRARCIAERATSPLSVGDVVRVVGMASEDVCEHEIFVLMRWKRRTLAIPLGQLEGVDVDEETHDALQDWRYWLDRGYEF